MRCQLPARIVACCCYSGFSGCNIPLWGSRGKLAGRASRLLAALLLAGRLPCLRRLRGWQFVAYAMGAIRVADGDVAWCGLKCAEPFFGVGQFIAYAIGAIRVANGGVAWCGLKFAEPLFGAGQLVAYAMGAVRVADGDIARHCFKLAEQSI